MSKKSRVGINFFIFLLSAKPEIVVPGKPSFVEAVL
jgi:hypothetical protein